MRAITKKRPKNEESKKYKTLFVRLNEDTHERLKRMAQKEMRTVSNYVRFILETCMKKETCTKEREGK